jgi:hypothetical protein
LTGTEEDVSKSKTKFDKRSAPFPNRISQSERRVAGFAMDASAPSTGDFSRDAAQITMRETREDDSKHALCVGALTAGCPDAFVDFHRLATADDGYGDDALTEEEAFELRIDIHAENYVKPDELPVEYARYVRDVLVRAESAEDPSTAVPAARATLAAFFRDKKDHEKASYFHQRDLDDAVAAGDVEAEVLATRRLAREREAQGAHVAAAAAFQKAAETAEREAARCESAADIIGVAPASPSAPASAADDASRDSEASTRREGDFSENFSENRERFTFSSSARASRADLARVLYASAHRFKRAGDARGEEESLEQCMAACERAGAAADGALEASARHELGLARHAAGDFARAAELQTAYLRACEISGDERGEGAARQARAYARRDAGDLAGAERDLLQFLAPEGAERFGREMRRELSRERKSFDADELELIVAEARGWRALGKMQSARGAAADAATSHEKFFELASVCGDKALEREARVCLGEARAAARHEALMRAVTERAEKPAERLMAWKSDGASFFDV